MLSGNTNVGPAMDKLDASCKIYKECLKCTQDRHGKECIPEFINGNVFDSYDVTISESPKQITCNDPVDSCNRT